MQLLKLAAKIPSYTTGERNPLSNIWGSHSSDCEDSCLLVCDAI
jgi:hypothetical protein